MLGSELKARLDALAIRPYDLSQILDLDSMEVGTSISHRPSSELFADLAEVIEPALARLDATGLTGEALLDAERARLGAECAAWASAEGMPALVGTPKQAAWGEQIRRATIEAWRAIEDGAEPIVREGLTRLLESYTDASIWIDTCGRVLKATRGEEREDSAWSSIMQLALRADRGKDYLKRLPC